MSEQDSVPPNTVATSFLKLRAVAQELNRVSDELGTFITELEGVLKDLQLGVPTWVKVSGEVDHESESFWFREIGYARVGAKWGLAVRTRSGDYTDPATEECEQWLFNDAPRALRIEAVDKLPELLEGMIKEASSTAQKIKSKIGRVQQVVTEVGGAAKTPLDGEALKPGNLLVETASAPRSARRK